MPLHTIALLLFYALGYWLALWNGGEGGFHSVWYPAAGLRLAFLWIAGSRFTPAIAMIEILVNLAMGSLSFALADWPITLWGIVSPVLAYGATVAFVRWCCSDVRASLMIPPIPFGLAGVAAPSIAALMALAGALWAPGGMNGASGKDIVTSLIALTLGDLLGVFIVAPPLLWMAQILAPPRKQLRAGLNGLSIPWKSVAEATAILAAAMFATAVLVRISLDSQPAPLILAVAWIGLRFGSSAVWIALAAVLFLMLSASPGNFTTLDRLQHHFDFATVAVAGYLAGIYRDAQKRARTDLERRDRLLFQAERLKTLRAMSVAVIHEISQPLSTLAIEAKHLHEITAHSDEEIVQSAAIVDRKAATLSNLVRRLRRFGGGAVDKPSPLLVAALIESVVAMAEAEAKSEGVVLKVRPIHPDLVVLAQEVELSQAVINLLRNAIHASSDGKVEIGTEQEGGEVTITVSNRCDPGTPLSAGMGIGTLVAQAIVEAHEGRLERLKPHDGLVVASVVLPLRGDLHE